MLGRSNLLWPLADVYASMPIDMVKITRFAEKLGSHTKITIAGTWCRNNPQWGYLCNVSGERYTSPIDRDYFIQHFDVLAARKSLKLARLVWNTVCSLPDTGHDYDAAWQQNPLRAVYRKNERGGARFADSQLVHPAS